MYYLKNKYFARWARKNGISDHELCEAIKEFEEGLFEADLGNHLFKKRIAVSGRKLTILVTAYHWYLDWKEPAEIYPASKPECSPTGIRVPPRIFRMPNGC